VTLVEAETQPANLAVTEYVAAATCHQIIQSCWYKLEPSIYVIPVPVGQLLLSFQLLQLG
jgi:hypothetical protein